MKSLFKKMMCTLLLFGLLVSSQAQLRDVMLKKAGDKMKKNKTENTATSPDKTTENTGTSTETKTTGEAEQNASKQEQPSNTNTSNGGAYTYGNYGANQGGAKEIQSSYKFEQNILMEMKKFDKKGNQDKETTKMRMHFGKEPYNGMETYDEKNASRGFMIFEAEKKQMVMLMDNNGKKMAMVHKVDPSKYADKQQQDGKGDKQPTITKTGRTKKVCNYTCEEWTSVDDKGEKTEMWISSEVPIKNNWYSMFSQNKDYAKYFGDGSGYPTGTMMEMTHYENNGEKFSMTATEVNLNAPKTIDTAGYQVF